MNQRGNCSFFFLAECRRNIKEPGLARLENKTLSYPSLLPAKDSEREKWLQGKDQIQGVSADSLVRPQEI